MSFDLTVKREHLDASLGKAVSFIPNSSAGRTSVVYLKPQGDRLRVAVSYPDVAFSSLCPVQGEGDGDVVALYGRKFYDIIKQTQGDVRLTFEGAEFAIRCEGAKWVERPIRGDLQDPSFPGNELASVDSADLERAFSNVSYVAGKDTIVPSLYAIDVQEGRVRASNGANYHEVSTGVAGLNFQVSNVYVDSFIKLLKRWVGQVRFSSTEANYYFQHEDDVLVLRKLNAPFPDLDRLLLRPMKAQAQFLLKVRKSELSDVLRKVRVSSSDSFPYVELHLSQGQLIARCLGDDGVAAVGRIEAIWNTEPRIATFNTNQLYNIVANQQDDVLEIRFAKDTKARKSPIILEGKQSWSMLTQLKMRPRA